MRRSFQTHSRTARFLPLLLLPPLLGALGGCMRSAEPDAAGRAPAEARSLTGEPLYAPPLDRETREKYEANLERARALHESDPTDLEGIVWYGRRTAYLGRYREAIDIYSSGLSFHPGHPELLRHRGHRYITVRELDLAIADLERAARGIEGKEDQVEPDGLPNARNIPTSTLHSNIWYHLGLARYVSGDLDGALAAYRRCMEVSGNPDMLVATSHWLYMTLRRLDRDDEAAAVLEPIHAGMDIIENDGYHRLLLLYKGELAPGDLLAQEGDAIAGATVGYGVGNWHLYNGRREEAFALFRRIVRGPMWPAFGHLAAEAELARPASPAALLR